MRSNSARLWLAFDRARAYSVGMETQDQIVEPVQGVVEAEKPRKPGTFVKGDPRIYDQKKASHGRKKPKTEYVGPVDSSAPEELILSWHVLNNDAEHDKTAAQRNMRKAFDAGPLGFRKHVQALEAEWRRPAAVEKEKVEPDRPVVEVVPDLGEDRCVSMIEGLIKKHKEKPDAD